MPESHHPTTDHVAILTAMAERDGYTLTAYRRLRADADRFRVMLTDFSKVGRRCRVTATADLGGALEFSDLCHRLTTDEANADLHAHAERAQSDDDYPPCPRCGDPIDYCQGHGELGSVRTWLPGVLVAVLVVIAAALALVFAGNASPTMAHASPVVRCAEDDPCWHWPTMGNLKRGVVTMNGTPLVVGPCRFRRLYEHGNLDRYPFNPYARKGDGALKGDGWARRNGCR